MDIVLAIGLFLAVAAAYQEEKASHGDINRSMRRFLLIAAASLVVATLLE